ncbi:hypothetical protein HYC85_006119 [Camellia sinensis]|uniref:Uncharacterized protein n=1 Tax=Camellia sinensis TaxID=4442 RepID=A0A7J7I390_CAMSI|nr:hypothetical protein HYC85_006119 [Camellia sinensis]
MSQTKLQSNHNTPNKSTKLTGLDTGSYSTQPRFGIMIFLIFFVLVAYYSNSLYR